MGKYYPMLRTVFGVLGCGDSINNTSVLESKPNSKASFVTEQSDFISNMLDIDLRHKPTIRISHNDRDYFLKSNIKTLFDVNNISHMEYRHLIDDLLSKHNPKGLIKLPIKNRTKFNWHANCPFFNIFGKVSSNDFLSTEKTLKKPTSRSQVLLSEYLITSILKIICPELILGSSPEVSLNLFFDILYGFIYQRLDQFYVENLNRMMHPDFEDPVRYLNLDCIYSRMKEQYEDEFLNCGELKDRNTSLVSFRTMISKFCADIRTISEVCWDAYDPVLMSCAFFLEDILNIYKDYSTNNNGEYEIAKEEKHFVNTLDNIMRFCIEFICSGSCDNFESISEKSLSSCDNMKFTSIIKKSLRGFSNINMFDFTNDNFRFYFIAQMIGKLQGFSDAVVLNMNLEYDNSKEMDLEFFTNTFMEFGFPDINNYLFCSRTKKICMAFLDDPNIFNKNGPVKIRDIFNEDEIKEMVIFGMIALPNKEEPKPTQ